MLIGPHCSQTCGRYTAMGQRERIEKADSLLACNDLENQRVRPPTFFLGENKYSRSQHQLDVLCHGCFLAAWIVYVCHCFTISQLVLPPYGFPSLSLEYRSIHFSSTVLVVPKIHFQRSICNRPSPVRPLGQGEDGSWNENCAGSSSSSVRPNVCPYRSLCPQVV